MARLFLALPLSVLISLSLFSLMAWMVDKSNQGAPQASEAVRFDMVMLENDADVQRRQRSVPEQPKPPSSPEPMNLAQVDTQIKPVSPVTPISALGLNTAIDGIAISAPNLTGTMGSQRALPLYRVEPRYPINALKRRVEGYVIMQFTIDAAGRPKDIQVIEAKPKRVFEKEAVNALKKWKYQPKVEEGVSVEQFGQTAKVEFKLAK
jgi:protein TonB